MRWLRTDKHFLSLPFWHNPIATSLFYHCLLKLSIHCHLQIFSCLNTWIRSTALCTEFALLHCAHDSCSIHSQVFSAQIEAAKWHFICPSTSAKNSQAELSSVLAYGTEISFPESPQILAQQKTECKEPYFLPHTQLWATCTHPPSPSLAKHWFQCPVLCGLLLPSPCWRLN